MHNKRTVGVPKREPCQRCQLPVFLAERLTHAGRLYHRTCLRCARCSGQLTPGSFYETEADGQFCCETCPDEEEKTNATTAAANETPKLDADRDAARQSFSHKLALFQARSAAPVDSSSRTLLSKSLSDEEKSKSLKRLTAMYQQQQQQALSEERAVRTSFVRRQLAGKDVADVAAEAPSSVSMVAEAAQAAETSSEEDDDDEDEEDDDDGEEDADDDDAIPPPALPTVAPPNLDAQSATSQSIEATPVEPVPAFDVDTTDAPSVVRADVVTERLVEEAAAVHTSTDATESEETPVLTPTDVAAEIVVSEPISPIRSVTEEQTPEETAGHEPTDVGASTAVIEPIQPSRSVTKEEVTLGPVVVDTSDEPGLSRSSPTPLVVPTPRRRAHKQIRTDVEPAAPPVTVKPVARERSTVPVVVNVVPPPPPPPGEAVAAMADPPPAAPAIVAEKPTSYPVAFNPFGDDDDDDGADDRATTLQPPAPTAERRNSYNPFDSSDDEVELDKLATLKATVATTTKLSTSLNPFGSDDDEDDDDVEVQRLAALKRTPVPTPRTVILPPPSSSMSMSMSTSTPAGHHHHHHRSAGSSMHSTPEPQRRLSAHQPPNHHHNQRQTVNYATPSPLHRNSQLYGSVSSLASTASALNAYTRRFKKRAPLPPSSASASPLASSSSTTPNRTAADRSIDGSPSVSGRSTPSTLGMLASGRKKRVAPPPPPPMTPQPVPTTTTPAEAAAVPPHTIVEPDGNVPDEPAPTVLDVDASKADEPTDTAIVDAQPVLEAVLTDRVDEAAAVVEKPPTPPAAPAPEPMEMDVGPTTATTATDAIVSAETDIVLEPMPCTPPPKARRQLIPAASDTSDLDEPSDAEPKDHTDHPVPVQTPPKAQRKLIPLDASLLDDLTPAGKVLHQSYASAAVATDLSAEPEPVVVYRRTIVPAVDEDAADTTDTEPVGAPAESHDRQWQKVKENKESLNKNRQSQCASQTSASSPESQHTAGSDTTDCVVDVNAPAPEQQQPPPYSNKSTFGKWKRRKATAPPPPTATSSASIIVQSSKNVGGVQMLPLTDIRYELEVIEVQQQGLEKQGIQLEKMIRDRCEGSGAAASVAGSVGQQQQQIIEEVAQNVPNTKEVEDLILQLFEIVNEKNELFRRQAELMYLRRLHRLEQEQADIEYDIRMLMEQPESNKTDSDKAREDGLIARKIEIVLQRNEVIDCLECDRLREAEEDQSIKTRLDEHNARWDEELAAGQLDPVKLSKKEKKKLRETKKLAKQKKVDADKDADESEVGKPAAADATKKKKRKFLF